MLNKHKLCKSWMGGDIITEVQKIKNVTYILENL